MKIKRVLQGTALTALAAAAWMGAGSTDASAAINDVKITTAEDDSYVLAVVADSDDLEIMVGVAKVSAKDGKAKVSAWDVYESNSAEVDLSKLNVTNDNYFAIKTDDMSAPNFYGIAAAAKKNKIEFNAGTAKITKFESTVGKATAPYTGDIEVRTATGDWDSITQSESFANYQYQGATLYVRVPHDANKKTEKTEVTDITYKKDNTVKSSVTPLGSLPSKETKLNIAKQANGPKVAVDYVKGTVTLPAKTEYRVVVDSLASPAAVDAKTIKTPSELLGTSESGVLEVRKAANTEKKGKAASKWSRVEIQKPVAAGIEPATGISTGSAVEVTVATAGSVKLQFAKDKKEAATGLIIKTSADIDYFIGVPEGDAKGFKAIKKGKKVTLKKDLVNGKAIYIRTSGVKKDMKWAGAWEKLADISIK